VPIFLGLQAYLLENHSRTVLQRVKEVQSSIAQSGVLLTVEVQGLPPSSVAAQVAHDKHGFVLDPATGWKREVWESGIARPQAFYHSVKHAAVDTVLEIMSTGKLKVGKSSRHGVYSAPILDDTTMHFYGAAVRFNSAGFS
jgi:hypothetical protein